MIAVVCPGCHRRLQLADTAGGHEGKCAHCGRHVRLGASATDPAQDTNDTASNLAPETGSHPPSPPRTSAPGYEFLAPPEKSDEIGRLGNYRILELLGQGAMGMVFRAEDLGLARIVALKVMLPSVASVPENRERFRREAQATALVNHRNVIPIYNIGEARGVPFLAMPLLKGEMLEARLNRERKLSVGDAVRLGREIAAGLAAAHERNLIHRDIKPANLWLEPQPRGSAPDRVKILDFGLARIGDAGLTSPGAVLGTPAYMSPEQAKGLPVDYRCDLFSLGCVFYRMLTGDRAFQGNEVFAVLMALTTIHPPAPHEVNPAIPVALSNLVMHLLAKDPADRPQSAAEVVEALDRMGLSRASSSGAMPAFHSDPVMPVASRTKTVETVPAPKPDPGTGSRSILLGILAAVLLAATFAAYWALNLFVFKAQGTVLLDVRPVDSEVFVDSKPIALDATGMSTLNLSPGKHELKVHRKDYHGKTKLLDITAGNNSPVSVELKKLGEEGAVPDAPPVKDPGPKEPAPKEAPRKEVAPAEDAPKPPAPKEPPPPQKAPNKAAKEDKPPVAATESKSPAANDPTANVPTKGLTAKSGHPTKGKSKTDREDKSGDSSAVKETPQPLSVDRKAIAEWVLDCGGRLTIKIAQAQQSQGVTSKALIPSNQFDLEGIDLGGRQVRHQDVNDESIKRLVGLGNELGSLDLTGARVTDAALPTLQNFRALKFLYLKGTAITDAAVPRLKGMKGLKQLDLQDTQVTSPKIKELRAALPDCNVME
jgi:serine/threonine protein kinase